MTERIYGPEIFTLPPSTPEEQEREYQESVIALRQLLDLHECACCVCVRAVMKMVPEAVEQRCSLIAEIPPGADQHCGHLSYPIPAGPDAEMPVYEYEEPDDAWWEAHLADEAPGD